MFFSGIFFMIYNFTFNRHQLILQFNYLKFGVVSFLIFIPLNCNKNRNHGKRKIPFKKFG